MHGCSVRSNRCYCLVSPSLTTSPSSHPPIPEIFFPQSKALDEAFQKLKLPVILEMVDEILKEPLWSGEPYKLKVRKWFSEYEAPGDLFWKFWRQAVIRGLPFVLEQENPRVFMDSFACIKGIDAEALKAPA